MDEKGRAAGARAAALAAGILLWLGGAGAAGAAVPEPAAAVAGPRWGGDPAGAVPFRGLPARGPDLALLGAAPRLAPPELAAGPGDGVEPAALGSPKISGLPWRSGASADASFGAWRGRALDVRVLFIQHDSWDQMRGKLRGSQFRTGAAQTPLPVVSLALMPRSERKQHQRCASGAFDGYFREFGALIAAAGAGHAVVRLGWEANAGSGSHPWGIDQPSEIPAYAACFRQAVAALRSTAPGVRIEWTNAKKGKLRVSELEAYPGDASVDVWGVHYYDSGPRKATQAVWDDYAKRTDVGGPWGIDMWLQEARARGKSLSVPEWGVWDNGEPADPDNPLYIENMYRFFRSNAAGIEYENYYNRPLSHQLHPSTRFPQARARYQQLWSSGQ